MTEEIKAIIEKSLPAQVGEILKQTLEKGKKDEAELKATVIAYDNARKEIEKHLAKINDYKQFDERNSKLEATGEAEIIEKNYWKDTFFGVDDKTFTGANVLGKILMMVREELKTNSKLL